MCRLLLCMSLCLQSLLPAPPAAICFLAPSHSPAAPAMAAASRCDECGLGLWSPATRCAGCTAQARLNHAVAHRIWPAATWCAVGMALSAILAMADAQVDTGDGAGERDRARSRSRSRGRSRSPQSSSEAAHEAPGPRPRPMESGRPSRGGGRGGGKGGGKHNTAPTYSRKTWGPPPPPGRRFASIGASDPPAQVRLPVHTRAFLCPGPGCG